MKELRGLTDLTIHDVQPRTNQVLDVEIKDKKLVLNFESPLFCNQGQAIDPQCR